MLLFKRESEKKPLILIKLQKFFFLMAVYFTISKVDHITPKKNVITSL